MGAQVKRTEKISVKTIKYLWQKNEGVILEDGNFVGSKSSVHPCCFSRKGMDSVSVISFEKFELEMEKN